MSLLAGIALIGGALRAIKGVLDANSSTDEAINQLTAAKTEAQNSLVDLENNYLYQTTKLANQYDQSRNDTYQAMAQNQQSAQLSANMSAYSNVLQDRTDQQNLIDTIVSGMRSVGQLRQRAAASGFTMSEGTTTRAVVDSETSRINSRIQLARDTVELSSTQRFLAARMSWLDAQTRNETYLQNLRRMGNSYRLEKSYMDTEYSNKTQRINDAIADYDEQMRDIEGARHWNNFLGFISGGMAGSQQAMNIYDDWDTAINGYTGD